MKPKNIQELAKEVVKTYKEDFAGEITIEAYLDAEYDTCAPFTYEVDEFGGLRKLEEACRAIAPELF